MASHLVDLDGTLLISSTQDLADGARKFLDDIQERGDDLIIVTRRGDREFAGHPIFSKEATLKALRENGVEFQSIVFDATSPRTVYDDSGCFAVNVMKNQGMEGLIHP